MIDSSSTLDRRDHLLGGRGKFLSRTSGRKGVMSMRKLLLISVALVAAMLFVLPASAQAARGQCGLETTSWQGYYIGLQKMGVTSQAAEINRSAGYRSVDGSFKSWLRERVVVARLARSVTIDNYGCNPGVVFSAGQKPLTKGWPVLVALPAKFAKSDVSTTRKKGYKRITVRVSLVGQATCNNPGKGKVVVNLWVKKTKRVVGKTKVVLQKRTNASYGGKFTFRVKIGTRKAKVLKIKANRSRSLGVVRSGTKVKVTEVAIPQGWAVRGTRAQIKRVRGDRTVFRFINVKRKQPKPSQPVCAQGTKWSDAQQICVVNDQDQRVKQDCKANEIWNGQQCVVIQVNCGNVIVGNGNVINGDNCGNKEVNICTANGGSWHNDVCIYPPPPPKTHECPPGNTWNGKKCVKDGTTTPPPPPEAPGTNPPPSGGPGDPGSNKCYDEITGQPVNPRTDGTCPVGSYGG